MLSRSFSKGDVFHITKRPAAQKNWLVADQLDGTNFAIVVASGWIPKRYIEAFNASAAQTRLYTTGREQAVLFATSAAKLDNAHRASRKFEATKPKQISFAKGALLDVVKLYPNGWCQAKLMGDDGTTVVATGFAPARVLDPLVL